MKPKKSKTAPEYRAVALRSLNAPGGTHGRRKPTRQSQKAAWQKEQA